MTIDWPTLINWIVSGVIGLIFGVVSAWFAHRYEKRRDDIAWTREKEKIKEQFAQEKVLLDLQYKQRIAELEKQMLEKQQDALRSKLLEGLENPKREIQAITQSRAVIRGTGGMALCLSTNGVRSACHKFKNVLLDQLQQGNDFHSTTIHLFGIMKSPRIVRNITEWNESWQSLIKATERMIECMDLLEDVQNEIDCLME